MMPTIEDGAFAFYIKADNPRFVEGHVYLFRHDELGVLLKRLVRHDGEYCLFEGDNEDSFATHQIGSVRSSSIIGRVVLSVSRGGCIKLHSGPVRRKPVSRLIE